MAARSPSRPGQHRLSSPSLRRQRRLGCRRWPSKALSRGLAEVQHHGRCVVGMIIIHHRVENFPTWKRGYDNHADKRKAAGLSHDHVLQAMDDPNMVTVVLDFA